MCGLFGGMSGYLSANEVDAIRTLGVVSVLRGDHSTGIGVIHRPKKKRGLAPLTIDVLKDTIDPYGMLYHKDFNTYLKSIAAPQCIIGHCRQATVGNVTVENAHPYEFENIVGAHNGTISKLANVYKNGEKPTTDSYRLYELINEHGIDVAIKDYVPHDGAYALSWYDKKAHTLNLLHNDQRPLYIGTAAGGNTIFWASDPLMLSLTHRYRNVNIEKINELPVNVLHTWNVGNPKGVRTREVKQADPPPVTSFYKRRDVEDCSNHASPFNHGIERPEQIHNFSELATRLKEKEDADEGEVPFAQQSGLPMLPPPPVKSGSNDTTERLPANTNANKKNSGGGIPRKIFPADATVNAESIDSAVYLYGSNIPPSTFPDMISIRDGTAGYAIHTAKHLRYKHPDGTLMPIAAYEHLLSQGCQATGIVAERGDSVCWLNDTEYVLSSYYQDFYEEYSIYGPKPKSLGRLVYASLKTIKAINDSFGGEKKHE